MERLDAMAAFVAVAESRGFAAAARRLGLSPSAVTRLVAVLEEHLSIRLLQRTTRSVSLTDAGARYLERVRRILADVEEAEATARAERTEPTGRFVVTASSVFGRREVAPLMCTFLSRHPKVVGVLTLTDSIVNMVEEGVDLAVRIGVLEDSSLVARRVGETRRVLVASPRYLARRKTPRTPAELASHALIQLTSLTPTAVWRFVREGKEFAVPVVPAYVTNSADAAIGHAELGGGITLVLAYQVAEAVRAGKLRVLLPSYEPPPLPIQLVYPSTRLASAAVRSFIDLVVTTRNWHFVDV
ncbi:MAG: LysR family transcriptional regulator [Myxococcota bacterium]